MNELMAVCNISGCISPIRCTSNNFFDWDTYLDRIYTRPAPGTLNKNHIFQAIATKPGFLITEIIQGQDFKEQNLIKLKNETCGQNAARTRIIKSKKIDLTGKNFFIQW